MNTTLQPTSPALLASPVLNASQQQDKENASRSIEQLREISSKLLKQSLQAGAAVGPAIADMIKAIWNMIMAIIRFIARIFRPKGRVQESIPDETVTDKDRSPKPPESPETAAVANLASAEEPGKFKNLGDKVNADAKEAKKLINLIASTPQASPLLKALEYAGVDEATTIIFNWLQDPKAFTSAQGPSELLESVLNKGLGAFDALESKTLAAYAQRAEQAAKLSSNFEPPVLIEDLVNIYRSNLKEGGVVDSNMHAAVALIKSDDALKDIVGHKGVIRETLILAAASAVNAGAKLDTFSTLLERAAGHDWKKLVEAAGEEIKAADAKPASEVFSNLMDRVNPLQVGAAPASTSTIIIAAADQSDPKAKLSVMERMKQAVNNQQTSTDYFDPSDHPDLSNNSDTGPKP